MVDQTALTLYGVLRDNSGLWAELNRITDREEFCAAIVDVSKDQGVAVDLETVRKMTPEMLTALIQGANDDDELTDGELELVAAGVVMKNSGANML
ncbi:hypothetical protein [Rhodospirillum sp. A1_3_36]|uniref:hypothetical protein n=1 Tax=Rhodospirillum sp. A1_3_36 TaxID=3391666 RepID=UPI0039A5AC02